MRQRNDESSDDFVSRITNQANLCKFKDRDERIIEQIAYGTKYAEVQKSLLAQDEDYTLAQALEACRVYDASVMHQQAFKGSQGGETHHVDVVQRGYKSAKRCHNCGQFRHRSPQGCPAKGTTCNRCGGADHWAKARACLQNSPANSTFQCHDGSRSHGYRNKYSTDRRQGSSPHARRSSYNVSAVEQAEVVTDDSFDTEHCLPWCASGNQCSRGKRIRTCHSGHTIATQVSYRHAHRVGNSSLLGHCPFGLDVNLIFKGTEASWEGTKATFHPSPGAPRPV